MLNDPLFQEKIVVRGADLSDFFSSISFGKMCVLLHVQWKMSRQTLEIVDDFACEDENLSNLLRFRIIAVFIMFLIFVHFHSFFLIFLSIFAIFHFFTSNFFFRFFLYSFFFIFFFFFSVVRADAKTKKIYEKFLL